MKRNIINKLLSVTLVLAMTFSLANTNLYSVSGNDTTKTVEVSVFDEIEKTGISDKKLDAIADEALEDGVKAAREVNAYKDKVDFDAALNSALTSYYETENFDEYKKFENTVDNRADEVVADYKEAAEERALGNDNGFETGVVVARFDKGTTKDEINAVVEAENGSVRSCYKNIAGAYICDIEISLGQTVEAAEDAYEDYSITSTVQSNDIVDLTATMNDATNDPFISNQYHLNTLNTRDAWDILSANPHRKVVVGVIDTGVQVDHPDLKNVLSPLSVKIVDGEQTLLSQCEETQNYYHGTAVSGVIAAEANNGAFVTGVASGYDNSVVELLAVYASFRDTDGKTRFHASDVIKGMDYCGKNGAEVINLSLGGTGNSTVYNSEVADLIERNIIVVAAAGNNGKDEYFYPACTPGVISVANTNSGNNLSSTSNYGPNIDICAPGTGIYTLSINNAYTVANGTSLASPMVAAVAAMMRSIDADITADEALEIMRTTATDVAESSASKVNYGVVNAGKCIQALVGDNYENCKQDENVNLGAWNYYVGSWAGASASYKAGDTLEGFSLNVKTNNLADWGIQAYTNEQEVIPGHEYNYVVKLNSSKAGASVLLKDDCNNVNLQTLTLKEGENVFSGKYTATTNRFKFFLDLSKLVAGTAVTVEKVELTDTSVPETTVAYTTTVAPTTVPTTVAPTTAATTQAPTTVPTTTNASTNPYTVIGLTASCPADNTVGVVWGQDAERINSGCTYNVYIDDVLKASGVFCNYYTYGKIAPGNHTVKVTSVYNGVESTPSYVSVNVTGNAVETTVQTTTQAPTTVAQTTVAATTTKAPETTTAGYSDVAGIAKASASSEESDSLKAGNVNDGDASTRWSSKWADGEWVQLDLGASYTVATIGIKWEAAYARQYSIQYSMDGVNFTTASSSGSASYSSETTNYIYNKTARYIRIVCDKRATSYGVSIYEISVLAKKNAEETTTVAPTTTSQKVVGDISTGKSSVTASSQENDSLVAGNVADGNTATRWSSAWTDNEWIQLDLGSVKYVEYVKLQWEAARAATYVIEYSTDGVNWSTTSTLTCSGDIESKYINANARYIKMRGITRATGYGYSLFEMTAFGY